MPTDLHSAIREALRADDITAADLIHPTLRASAARRHRRLLAAATAVAAVITVAVLVAALVPGRGGQHETGGDPLAGVVGHRWRVTGVADPHGRIPVPAALHARVGFTRDGYVLGDDTVNALQGNYAPARHGYSVHDAASTLVGSAGIDPVRKRIIAGVDALFFTVVSAPEKTPPKLIVELSLTGDVLTLRHDTTTLTLDRAGPEPDFGPVSSTPPPSR